MSNSSREYSPDWLRNQQQQQQQAPPTTSIWTLTSSSSSSEIESTPLEDDDDQLPISSVISHTKRLQGSKGDNKGKPPPPPPPPQEPKTSVFTFSSDSEHDAQPPKLELEDDAVEETSLKRPSKLEELVPAETKFTEQENDDVKVLERETTDEKQTGPYVSSSRLPLVLADKVQRSKVLVECEGESIDLSGDLGSVGRVVISDSHQDMFLDLKGTIYKTTIMPSRTLCVVSFGQSEAKIEAIMNDFIQLKPQSNVYEAETMVEGTLEGFSFDSEDEGDKRQQHQTTDENEPQTNGKSSREAAAAKKKGKTAVKKPAAKKVSKKKAPVAKKTKTKK